jgi:hypothetical protein
MNRRNAAGRALKSAVATLTLTKAAMATIPAIAATILAAATASPSTPVTTLTLPADPTTTPNVCNGAETASIHLSFNDDGRLSVIEGRLGGSTAFALELRDAHSDALLWTVGATANASLQVPNMNAPILARPAVIDLDGDGLADRIYAADTAGRIWRLDLHNGALRKDWARAVLFADLSSGGARGFIAAPDVVLHQQAGGAPWLSIAIGSTSIEPSAENRFYVLRDTAELALPIHDTDLRRVDIRTGTVDSDIDLANDPLLRGYYLPLGTAQVFTSSVTINGTLLFTTSLSTLRPLTMPAELCIPALPPTNLEVHALTTRNGAPALDLNADGVIDDRDAVLTLHGLHAADSALRFADTPSDAPGNGALRSCLIEAEVIPGCALDTHAHRRYWLREDAD